MIVPDGVPPGVFAAVVVGTVGTIAGLISAGFWQWASDQRGFDGAADVAESAMSREFPTASAAHDALPEHVFLRSYDVREFAEWLAGAGLGGRWITHARLVLLAQEYCWTEGVVPGEPTRGELLPAGFDRCLADLRHRAVDPIRTKWVIWRVPALGGLAEAEGRDYGHVQWDAIPALDDIIEAAAQAAA